MTAEIIQAIGTYIVWPIVFGILVWRFIDFIKGGLSHE